MASTESLVHGRKLLTSGASTQMDSGSLNEVAKERSEDTIPPHSQFGSDTHETDVFGIITPIYIRNNCFVSQMMTLMKC